MQVSLQVVERFWPKVRKSEGCWDWTASKIVSGYGKFNAGGTTVYAHRLAYELVVGPIPEGLTIDHLCRNRGCVNPTHLEVVSHGENVRRGAAAGTFGKANRVKTYCPHGHPYSVENTRLYRGMRYCKACGRGRRLR